MANNRFADDFPPDIAAAFDAYPTPPLSPDFETRFWAELEVRNGRYRGLGGFWRRFWELEIEGVAVWRLALSTLSGGAACALFFALFALLARPQSAPVVAKIPAPELPDTPRMAFDAHRFYTREWEFGFAAPQTAPLPPASGEISCVPFKSRLV